MIPSLLSAVMLCSVLMIDEGFHFTSTTARSALFVTSNKTKSQKATTDIEGWPHSPVTHGLRSGYALGFRVDSHQLVEAETNELQQQAGQFKVDHPGSRTATAAVAHTVAVAVEEEVQSMVDTIKVATNSNSNSKAKQQASVTIRHAGFNDLTSIINLRLKVFYPYLMRDRAFQGKLLYKVRQRFDRGSVCLVASLNNSHNSNSNHNEMQQEQQPSPTDNNHNHNNHMDHLSVDRRMNNLLPIGTVELNDFDFRGTSMETVGSPRKLYVADLAVREDCRRMGVASALLAAAEKYALNALYEAIYLHVEVHNTAGLQLYLSNGYDVYKPTPQSIHFTETHLQRPANLYVMLYKRLYL